MAEAVNDHNYEFGLFEITKYDPSMYEGVVVYRYRIQSKAGDWYPVYVIAPPNHDDPDVVDELAFVMGEGELHHLEPRRYEDD